MLGKTYQAAQAAGTNPDSAVIKAIAAQNAKTENKTEVKTNRPPLSSFIIK
jgi:hypothetical protein